MSSKSSFITILVCALALSMSSANAFNLDLDQLSENWQSWLPSLPESIIFNPLDATAAFRAVIYGQPCQILDKLHKQQTDPSRGFNPDNQFTHQRRLVKYTDPVLIVSPNADTLYSTAWLNVKDEPIVLSVPDTKDRFYVMEIQDAYSNVFSSVGRRTFGTGAGDFLLVSPTYNISSIPEEVRNQFKSIIQSPTYTIWILGRILVYDVDGDVDIVNTLQDQFTLNSLTEFIFHHHHHTVSSPASSSMPMDVSSLFNVHTDRSSMLESSLSSSQDDALAFLQFLGNAMVANPPPLQQDKYILSQFQRIHLNPQTGFNVSALTSSQITAVTYGYQAAVAAINKIVKMGAAHNLSKSNNGWTFSTSLGKYGTDYIVRALVAIKYVGANLAEDALYFMKNTQGLSSLSGANNKTYSVNIKPDIPVDAFWSISMYDASNYWFVNNTISRYSIGCQVTPKSSSLSTPSLSSSPFVGCTSGITINDDGSIDVYIQYNEPTNEKLRPNWLPAPNGDFYLLLRTYQPRDALLKDTYKLPSLH